MTTENRLMERFPMELPVKITAVKENRKERIFESTTQDISSGGAFIKTNQPLDMDTEVEMDLVLPLDQLKRMKGKKVRIKVSGLVVRSGENGMSICFDEDYDLSPVEDEN